MLVCVLLYPATVLVLFWIYPSPKYQLPLSFTLRITSYLSVLLRTSHSFAPQKESLWNPSTMNSVSYLKLREHRVWESDVTFEFSNYNFSAPSLQYSMCRSGGRNLRDGYIPAQTITITIPAVAHWRSVRSVLLVIWQRDPLKPASSEPREVNIEGLWKLNCIWNVLTQRWTMRLMYCTIQQSQCQTKRDSRITPKRDFM